MARPPSAESPFCPSSFRLLRSARVHSSLACSSARRAVAASASAARSLLSMAARSALVALVAARASASDTRMRCICAPYYPNKQTNK
eukprot:432435-Prorocentrum_minimum.AAC.1